MGYVFSRSLEGRHLCDGKPHLSEPEFQELNARRQRRNQGGAFFFEVFFVEAFLLFGCFHLRNLEKIGEIFGENFWRLCELVGFSPH